MKKTFLIILFSLILTISLAYAVPEGGVSRFEFDEGSGSIIGDSWGSNDGTATSMTWNPTVPTFNTSGDGGTYSGDFDGNNDEADFNYDFSRINSAGTISFWIHPRDLSVVGDTFLREDGSGYFECSVPSSGVIKCQAYDSSFVSINYNLSINNWYNLIMTWDGSEINFYENGVLVKNASFTGISGGGTSGFYFGRDATSSRYSDMLIDEIKIFDKLLNSSEVELLYNTGTLETNVAPTVTLGVLTADYHTNDNTPSFTFNGSDADGDNLTCYAYINDVLQHTQSAVTGSGAFTIVSPLSDGVYNWSVSCTDDVFTTNSSVRDFFVDTVSPLYYEQFLQTDNSSRFRREAGLNKDFAGYWFDNYMFAWNMSIDSFDGVNKYFTNVTGLTGTTEWVNNTINMISYPDGLFNVTHNGADDHTAKAIKDYDVVDDISKGSLIFTTDKKVDIEIKLKQSDEKLSSITYDKLVDRYVYNYYFEDKYGDVFTDYVFSFTCSEDVYYRDSLYPFPSFVCGDHWVDFNIPSLDDVSYFVERKSKTIFDVTVSTKSKELFFHSIGGLNVNTFKYQFEIYSNSAPVVSGGSLSNPVFSELSTTTNAYYVDSDGDSGNVTFLWEVNSSVVFEDVKTGVVNASTVYSTLTSGNYSEGDNLSLSVWASDGYNVSNNLTISRLVDSRSVSFFSNTPLNSSGLAENNFSSDTVQDIEKIRLLFDLDKSNSTVTGINLSYSALGYFGCAVGNLQHEQCYNFTNPVYKWILFVNDTLTDTFDGGAGNVGDSIVLSVNDTSISYLIDEHYNPNIFKHYGALFNFSDVKWQDGTKQRITRNNIILVNTSDEFIPLDADVYKLDIRVNYTSGVTNPLIAYACNSTYATVYGDPVSSPYCNIIAERTPSMFQDDGTKFRALFTKELVDELGDISYIALLHQENAVAHYYNIKTYQATAPSYVTNWFYSTNSGGSYANLGDGYETELNINWFYNGDSPTGTIYNLSVEFYDGYVANSLYNFTWDIDPSRNYPPLLSVNYPLDDDEISQADDINITYTAVDPNDDLMNLTIDVLDENGVHLFNLYDNYSDGFVYFVNNLSKGEYQLLFNLTDGSLFVEQNIVFNITNYAPVIYDKTPSSPLSMDVGSTRILSISVTDLENEDLTYNWSENGIPIIVHSNTSYSFTAGALDVGVNTVNVSVTDEIGQKTATSWVITVTTGYVETYNADDIPAITFDFVNHFFVALRTMAGLIVLMLIAVFAFGKKRKK